ncbi:unnamed protein product [Victoria cruziana]
MEEDAHVPAELVRCQLVPPAPNGTPNSISWLRDFAGFSWLAYGAASLAVVTHVASPLSKREAAVGSFFHQVLEPEPPPGQSDPSIFTVRALSWCPSVPSDGTLAVALGSSISLYSPLPDYLAGPSFRWRPITRLLQSFEAEAIEWTRSGDGLIAAGIEVVAWKKKDKCWEVLWRSHPEVPQALVSAAWSIHGTAATAAAAVPSVSSPVENSCPLQSETTKAIVWQSDKRYGIVKIKLNHPHPVSRIEWRPFCSVKALSTCREVLLTCSMDGVARLWIEIGQGRGRKYTKGINDQRNNKPHYYVAAVVEINQCLGGCLGIDIYVKWAGEVPAVNDKCRKLIQCHGEMLHSDIVGRCEWLVVVGPGPSLAFWSVHCLDDVSPLRFPRLHLWKKVDVSDANATNIFFPDSSKFQNSIALLTVFISRSRLSGPPDSCSLLHLLSGGSFMWLHLDRLAPSVALRTSSDQLSKDSCASISSCKLLTQDGHASSIVQFAMCTCSFGIHLAASLDSDGHILLWSICSGSYLYSGKPTPFQPAWKYKGRILSNNYRLGIMYSCLAWAPVLSNGNMLLLVGYTGGIDCFIVDLTSDASFEHHKICTVPFFDHSVNIGPDRISTSPLHSTLPDEGSCTSFMLIGVWMSVFQVLTWKFVVHLHDLVGEGCTVNVESDKIATYKTQCFGGNYCISVGLCSSRLPDYNDTDIVTSVYVVHSGASTAAVLQSVDSLVSCIDNAVYHMAIGSSDGKLWLYRSLQISDTFCIPWQLVGMFRAHVGAIDLISLSGGSGKVATVNMRGSDACSCLHIWDSVSVMDEGCFLLEDKIHFNDSINAIDFQNMGNGLLLLGVCLPSKLCIYSQKQFSDWDPIKSEFSIKGQNWVCIAHIRSSPSIRSFMWGPSLSLALLHEKYISIASQWSFSTAYECQADSYPEYFMDDSAGLRKEANRGNHGRAYAAVEHLVTCLDNNATSAVPERSKKVSRSGDGVHEIKLSKYFQGNCSSYSHVGSHFQKDFLKANSAAPNAYYDVFAAYAGESKIKRFSRILENSPQIPLVGNVERTQILALVDLLMEIIDRSGATSYESFDEPGRRFWVAVRFVKLHFRRKFGRAALAEELIVDSSLIAWAFLSDCHENLLSSVLSSEPSWLEMKNLGIGFWFTNATMLRSREEKNKAAALKNAYVLMGRHQLELAVAFFILGGDHSSAVTVCAKNLGDVQLALIICRLLEGCGGELERDLIATHLLPSSIQKGDYWLASILEWMLGHYYQSYLCLLHGELLDCEPSKSDIHHAVPDPNIGQYCAILALKSNIKNSLGDAKAAILARWAMMTASCDLARCGLPLQALEIVSSGSSIGGKIQGLVSGSGRLNTIYGILRPNLQTDSCNWISGDVAPMLESGVRLNLALRCTSKFIMEHLSSENSRLPFSSTGESLDMMARHYEELADALYEKLWDGTFCFETKYSVNATRIWNMILYFACNTGKPFLGYHVTNTYLCSVHRQHELHGTKNFIHHSFTTQAVAHVTKEICYEFGRCVVALGIMDFVLKINIIDTASNGKAHYTPWENHLYVLLQWTWYLKLFLKILIGTSAEVGSSLRISSDLDHLSYCICIALGWSHQNSEILLQLIRSILDIPEFTDSKEKSQLSHVLHRDSFKSSVPIIVSEHDRLLEKKGKPVESVFSNDERWQLLGACLWQNLFLFTLKIFEARNNDNLLKSPATSEPFLHGDPKIGDFNGKDIMKQIELFPLFVLEPLVNAISYIFCGLTKELLFFLAEKLETNVDIVTLTWLNDAELAQSKVPVQLEEREIDSSKSEHGEVAFPFEHLWRIIVKPEVVCNIFSVEGISWPATPTNRQPIGWSSIPEGIVEEVGKGNGSFTIGDASGPSSRQCDKLHHSGDENDIGTLQTGSSSLRGRLNVCFDNKEIVKKNGELLEAICVNSCDQEQIAVASNRKGLLFFQVNPKESSSDNTEYIWSESDWPQNGWSRSAFASPGIGFVGHKSVHVGLGVAPVGLNPLARPGRDLTGGGAFGIPGYAGIGASGLGWGEQEYLEEFVNPHVTVETICTRAISSHPSRPWLLVGSNNTYIYLWEFGKDTATATYGILPSANVPAPYALASISALRFDHCGHRFATSSSDGTVCTWQLEVGNLNNIQPTESSVCFQSYASGSISPLIITGGKAGDIGLHDFRFIATGKSKRHQIPKERNVNLSRHLGANTGASTKFDDNRNGMLWYLPKAHLGSITRISTIPNTCLFLTGSKDGDVKLWDAKRSELVFHWPKVHDRHTFLQPNSRGFGGVIRAAVTDIQVIPGGFLTCGGDGAVRLVQIRSL